MKNPSTRNIISDDLKDIISLSRNMKREANSLKFSTVHGNKKTLSLEDLFTRNEITLRCLKTDSEPACKYYCRFEKAFELNPLVQYFSWNDYTNCKLFMGSMDFIEQQRLLRLLSNLEHVEDKVYFVSTENTLSKSISLMANFDNMTIGAIIDFTQKDGVMPFKIFAMNVPKAADEAIEVFYTTPQKEHKSFELSKILIQSYSRFYSK